ncbi:MAG: hypothetical protein AAFU65_17795 [Pseudomonadota bacterium]
MTPTALTAADRLRPWLAALAASLALSFAVHAQDADDAEADTPAEAGAEDEDSVGDDSLLLPGGIFTPSEKIEADSEVSLPSDI